MALSYALTTVTRQKEFLSITGTTYDTVLDRLIDSCTDWIESYCDRRFKQTTYTNELYRGRDAKILQLKNFPVNSSSTFTLERRDSTLNEGNYSAIGSELYVVDYTSGIVRLVGAQDIGFSTMDSFRNIPGYYRVTYTAGYNYDNAATFLSTTGAADLEYAVWKLVGAAFNQRKLSGNIESEKIGDYSVTYTKEATMDDEIQSILARHRRIAG
jgi:hypothetical protein